MSWNRVILELTQAQPLEFGQGSTSVRLWINGQATDRVYFGDFAAGDYPITDGNYASLEICGYYDSTDSNFIHSATSGTFNLMNFLWYQGALNFVSNTTCKKNFPTIFVCLLFSH